jgi:hypothetical protein
MYRFFGGTYCLHLQGQRVSEQSSSKTQEAFDHEDEDKTPVNFYRTSLTAWDLCFLPIGLFELSLFSLLNLSSLDPDTEHWYIGGFFADIMMPASVKWLTPAVNYSQYYTRQDRVVQRYPVPFYIKVWRHPRTRIHFLFWRRGSWAIIHHRSIIQCKYILLANQSQNI